MIVQVSYYRDFGSGAGAKAKVYPTAPNDREPDGSPKIVKIGTPPADRGGGTSDGDRRPPPVSNVGKPPPVKKPGKAKSGWALM